MSKDSKPSPVEPSVAKPAGETDESLVGQSIPGPTNTADVTDLDNTPDSESKASNG